MNYEIKHIPEKRQFVAEVNGEAAWVAYSLYDDYLNITHTYVPRSAAGSGIAGTLVEATCKYALQNNMKPQAICPYAVFWLYRNPDYMSY